MVCVWLWLGWLKVNLNKHESQSEIPRTPFTREFRSRLRQHRIFGEICKSLRDGMCLGISVIYLYYFSRQWPIWKEEKSNTKVFYHRRLFCQNFVGCFPHLLRKILSSSHFKCSKAIAILISDKEWMRTANQPDKRHKHTRRPCPLWIMLLSYFDRRDISTTCLYTSCVPLYITPPPATSTAQFSCQKDSDKIIIRVNHCTCQTEWGKLRVFLSEKTSIFFLFFFPHTKIDNLHSSCVICVNVHKETEQLHVERLMKNDWFWGP